MDLRQLEYFITVSELKSINKAAEILFTSQPNVSKIITSLEKELEASLFNRTSKGVNLTSKGEEVYDYAKIILKNARMLTSVVKREEKPTLNIACYPSKMISRMMCDFYNSQKDSNIKIKFTEGTAEEVIYSVENNDSEIGVIYISDSQRCCFTHTLNHKNLEFVEIDKKELCIYVGASNPLYDKESVKFNELYEEKFIQLEKDQFSMYQSILEFKKENSKVKSFDDVVTTNSDHLMIDILQNTELCSFGIKFLKSEYQQYDIKPIDIIDYNDNLNIGYVKRKVSEISKETRYFIDMLEKIVKG